jgi:hypothetical protein
MLLEVLRRRPLATSQKLNITTNPTTSKNCKVKIRFCESTTTQQPQTAHEDVLRKLGEMVKELSRTLRESQRVSGEESEPEDLSARWQTINLALHGMSTPLAFEGKLLTEL